MKKRVWILLVIVMVFLVACSKKEEATKDEVTPAPMETGIPATEAPTPMPTEAPTATPTQAPTPAPTEVPAEPIYVEFTDGEPQGYEIADGWTNGSMFNVTWRRSNVTFEDGHMQLIIDKDAKATGDIPYSGGEFRSRKFYGYGRYEVCMKPIKNDGVVSSFFTYTGPSDNNPWDEIDIEFTGKDTTKVQFNYFTNGRGNHEYMHDLGFDASEDFHTYAFEWYEDKILWFVDGVEVHSADKQIPVTRGKIMMNAWCGTGVDSWLKAFDDSKLPLTAEYKWFSYTPFE